jgi:hypothetical protein
MPQHQALCHRLEDRPSAWADCRLRLFGDVALVVLEDALNFATGGHEPLVWFCAGQAIHNLANRRRKICHSGNLILRRPDSNLPNYWDVGR